MQHDELQRISDAGCAAVHLRVMSEQSDGRLNESPLSQVLDVYAHHRSREWIRQQLRHPADLGAVKITEVGAIMIAAITRLGADHVALERAKRPTIGA